MTSTTPSSNNSSSQSERFPPQRILDHAKLPLEKEVMELEYELEVLLSRDVLTDYENKLKNYLFKRCSKLWEKIYRSTHRAFVEKINLKNSE